jgi:hypothetical protein
MFYTECDGNSYPAQKRVRRVDGRNVTTWTREITSANILEAEAGTNGYQGGDSGHGSRTFLRVRNLACTDLRCRVKAGGFPGGADEVEIVLGGDTELETIKEALRWMLSVLEIQSETEG